MRSLSCLRFLIKVAGTIHVYLPGRVLLGVALRPVFICDDAAKFFVPVALVL
jgi:hypothetical protein